MIILDSNVISEVMRPLPAASVTKWLETQRRASVFSTTITQAEILYGIHLMPEGKRRDGLLGAAMTFFNVRLAGKVLSFDSDAAVIFSRLAADRRRSGRPISHPDAQIASITLSLGATLATRNLRDFEGCGIALVNPWDER